MVDQDAVIAFLSDPASHDGVTPERIETHGAMIFLLDERVYKMKRKVRYPFMDFSTREKRHTACRAEVRLNRRTAPEIYLGTLPILETPDGLCFGAMDEEPGNAVETVVVMKRFDGTLAEQPISEADLVELARIIAAFHDKEPSLSGVGGAADVWAVQEGNLKFLESDATADKAMVATLRSRSRAVWEEIEALLDDREAQGCIKQCHGDLHLANVCRWQGHPVPFDCVEFNPAFVETDTLYDLAFLLMDLEEHNRRDGATLVLNRYLECRPQDVAGLKLMPLFLAKRAQIRGKVGFASASLLDGEAAAEKRAEAHRFLELAIDYLSPPPPFLIAVGGPSGSGKSTVSKALAPKLGASPGAVIARTDAIRKRRYGGNAHRTDPLPQTAYSSKASFATYREMEEICEAALTAGQAAIADATFTHSGSRKEIEALADRLNVPFLGVWLDLDRQTAKARVSGRKGDVSDATTDVVDQQFDQGWGGVTNWLRIDARASLKDQVSAILNHLDSLLEGQD